MMYLVYIYLACLTSYYYVACFRVKYIIYVHIKNAYLNLIKTDNLITVGRR